MITLISTHDIVADVILLQMASSSLAFCLLYLLYLKVVLETYCSINHHMDGSEYFDQCVFC